MNGALRTSVRTTARISVAIVALGLAGVVGVGSLTSAAGASDLCEAFGAPYCPPGTTSDDTVLPGATIHIHGEGFIPGETVVVTFNSTPIFIGSFTADADGIVDADVTIPAGAAPGSHTIVMEGQTSGVVVEIPVEVVGEEAPAESGGGDLARTGSDTGSLTGIGLGLVVAGGAAAYAARRRAQSAQQSSHLV